MKAGLSLWLLLVRTLISTEEIAASAQSYVCCKWLKQLKKKSFMLVIRILWRTSPANSCIVQPFLSLSDPHLPCQLRPFSNHRNPPSSSIWFSLGLHVVTVTFSPCLARFTGHNFPLRWPPYWRLGFSLHGRDEAGQPVISAFTVTGPPRLTIPPGVEHRSCTGTGDPQIRGCHQSMVWGVQILLTLRRSWCYCNTEDSEDQQSHLVPMHVQSRRGQTKARGPDAARSAF